jgi:hypothetical protein
MVAKSVIELADRKSKLRAILFALAGGSFLLVQFLTHPAFAGDAYTHGWRKAAWAFNAGLLLLLMASGGGIMHNVQLRALINDEIAQANNRRACVAGFWMAMILALVLYLVPAFNNLTGAQATYVIITAGTSVAVLMFAWLEYRSHAE